MRKADPDLQARRRDEIVSAATQCFLENGFHRTSVADIATAAGVSMGLLYRYFPGKDAIISAVAERDTAETLTVIAALEHAAALEPALNKFIVDQATLAASPDYAALIAEIAAEAGRNDAIRRLWHEADHRIHEALATTIARHPDSSAPRGEQARVLASFVLTLIDGLSARAGLPDQPVMSKLLNLCRLDRRP